MSKPRIIPPAVTELQTKASDVFMFASNGHGAWEAAVENLVAPAEEGAQPVQVEGLLVLEVITRARLDMLRLGVIVVSRRGDG